MGAIEITLGPVWLSVYSGVFQIVNWIRASAKVPIELI